MTTIEREVGIATPVAATPPVAPGAGAGWRVLAISRIVVGWIFLWAFVDKLFGLGFATERADAWLNGGSPTAGYLEFATAGPFAGAYQAIAGAAWADWLFMLGLLGLGVALTLGIGMRVAAVAAVAMGALMWASQLPPETNPVVTYHWLYALLPVAFVLLGVGRVWGLGGWWERVVPERLRWLR